MRVVNDKRYADNAIGVDLILGGHDHIYWIEQRYDQIVMKSGCDYRCFTEIKLEQQDDAVYQKKVKKNTTEVITDANVQADHEYNYTIPIKSSNNNGQYEVKMYRRNITEAVEPDIELQAFVKSYDDKWNEKMLKTNCLLESPLDVRFSHIRTQESAIGNFLADIMRKEMLSDVAILNSGGIRADFLYEDAILTIGNWSEIFPFRQEVLKQQITGEQLHMILEGAVSKYPELEGRWPSISNIYFTFDPQAPPGKRILKEDIIIDEAFLNYDQKYSVACMKYCADGNDGYEAFKDSVPLIDLEVAPIFSDMLQKVFDYAKNPKFIEEFKLFKTRQNEINEEFFSVVVKEQLNFRKEMFDMNDNFGFNYNDDEDSGSEEDEETKEIKTDYSNTLELLRSISIKKTASSIGTTSSEGEELEKKGVERQTSDLLTADNIENFIAGKQKMSNACCIRLREYKLFTSIVMCEEGYSVFSFNPDIEGRVVAKK